MKIKQKLISIRIKGNPGIQRINGPDKPYVRLAKMWTSGTTFLELGQTLGPLSYRRH